MYLTAKFDRPTFSRSDAVVRTNTPTNKQTPLKTSPRSAMLRRWVTRMWAYTQRNGRPLYGRFME